MVLWSKQKNLSGKYKLLKKLIGNSITEKYYIWNGNFSGWAGWHKRQKSVYWPLKQDNSKDWLRRLHALKIKTLLESQRQKGQ